MTRTRLFIRCLPAVSGVILVCAHLAAARGNAQDYELWTFDRTDRIGGHTTTVVGNPRVIDTPVGKAIEFDGVDDGLFVDVHPLAGASAFTWEAIFRPDGGEEAQRWFHLQESGSENRMLFEIRVIEGRWCLDSYLQSSTTEKALIDRDKLHPVFAWYHVATVYDGRRLTNYVNGVQQGTAPIEFAPQKAGRSSIGARINNVGHFKGAIREARFTRRALAPSEFLPRSGTWKEITLPTPDGGTVFADQYGNGERGVVLVHGGRFNKASWATQAHLLVNAGFRVLAIDLRGYGKSSGPGQSDIYTAPLHLDVLAAVRYLRKTGAKTVAVVGASLGGGAAGDASVESAGEIDRVVFLAASASRPAEKLKGRTLFIVARDDADGSGVKRLTRIRPQYERAPEPKELIIVEGDAHAQYLFATDQGERVMREILRFLSER